MAARTRVLIVDDSMLMRTILTDLLKKDPEIEVVGTAQDPYIAWDKIAELKPDVLTLDVEMPRMDGLTFLDRLMKNKPMPVVMISSLTEESCETTMRALSLGAVDFVTKPKLDLMSGTMKQADEIATKVKSGPGFNATHRIQAVGASTGGCEAMSEVFQALPADAPGIVAVIHMPAGFTKSFAARLDKECAVSVSEARDGDRILPGHILIAPGNYHMKVLRQGAVASVRIVQEDPVNLHRPSVDVLFSSCAKSMGGNATGVILTGMGADGAKGLLEMKRAGAPTIAQNEATCVVFGMPKEAIALGAADKVLALDDIAHAMIQPPPAEQARPPIASRIAATDARVR